MSNKKQKDDVKNVTCVKVKPGYARTNKEIEIRYIAAKVIGTGSFGIVYAAKLYDFNEDVAIKKVYQDKRFKNRELQIMQRLEHPNIIRLMYYYYTSNTADSEYLHLVLEYMPKTIHQLIKTYAQIGTTMNLFYVKLYMFQLFRGLSFLSSMNMCHRDIKPHNLLVDPERGTLRICDFGSAKVIITICYRYYRAPELIFGSSSYTTKIDVWSAGTVMAEAILGRPLFCGDSAVNQLAAIIKVGSRFPLYRMRMKTSVNFSKAYGMQSFKIHVHGLFRGRSLWSAATFLSTVLRYNPGARDSAIEALAHPFFDELRNPNLETMPNGRLMPRLFDWLEKEVNIRPDLNRKVR
ncbi:unnamed protein product [Heligmosomoides polygyrus]|uniref:Protein kinase domain-containing protein n=1 Tax=Heligmosomoides polygyrus TaxID=6339 RepID=A0A183G296_HELPZ|nr:unnamed protein product [Heligmosomoides polygyrus]